MTEDQDTIRIHRPTIRSGLGPKCFDLFAGAGGLALGFRQAGWSVIGGNDSDASACKSFRRNFPEALQFEGPISAIDQSLLLDTLGVVEGEIDVVIGGPPCQSFSYNNHRRTADGERANLFKHYLATVKTLQPKCIVMENVPGILTVGNGSVIRDIEKTLADMGYDSHVAKLSSDEFGTPQIRKRVFILASRICEARLLEPSPSHGDRDALGTFDSDLKPRVTVGDAIFDLPPIENGGGSPVSSYRWKRPHSEYSKTMRDGSKQLHNHQCHRLTEVNLSRIRHVPEGGNWRDVPFHKLPAGMQRAKKSDHTKRYGRLDRHAFASTVLTKCDPHWGAYVHPTHDRTITVREAARLQGFPDTFIFEGSNLSKLYEQVGNAVPVQVAEAIAMRVSKALQQNQSHFKASTSHRELNCEPV